MQNDNSLAVAVGVLASLLAVVIAAFAGYYFYQKKGTVRGKTDVEMQGPPALQQNSALDIDLTLRHGETLENEESQNDSVNFVRETERRHRSGSEGGATEAGTFHT